MLKSITISSSKKNPWENVYYNDYTYLQIWNACSGEAEMVVEGVETVAEVVEKVATAAEKVSAKVAEKLPDDSKLKIAAMEAEHVSEITAHGAHATTNFIHQVINHIHTIIHQ